jgi:hypothetical protein
MNSCRTCTLFSPKSAARPRCDCDINQFRTLEIYIHVHKWEIQPTNYTDPNDQETALNYWKLALAASINTAAVCSKLVVVNHLTKMVMMLIDKVPLFSICRSMYRFLTMELFKSELNWMARKTYIWCSLYLYLVTASHAVIYDRVGKYVCQPQSSWIQVSHECGPMSSPRRQGRT